MKMWRRPLLINVSNEQMNEAVKAAAFTCLNKFLR